MYSPDLREQGQDPSRRFLWFLASARESGTGVELLDLLILWREMRFGFPRLRKGVMNGNMELCPVFLLVPLRSLLFLSLDGLAVLAQDVQLLFYLCLVVLYLVPYDTNEDISEGVHSAE